MKILFATDLYPVKSTEKNTPRTLAAFVENWRDEGHEVDIIKPNFLLNSFLRKKPFYKTGMYNDVYNVNYFTPFWFEVKDKLPKKLECPRKPRDKESERGFGVAFQKDEPHARLETSSRQVAKTRLEYDMVLAHMPSGILFADKLGLPFIAGVHVSDLEVLTNPLYSFCFKKRLSNALSNAKGIACRSEILKQRLLKLFPEFKSKTFTAPSGIKEDLIKRREPLQNHDDIKVVTCANLIKRKNVDKIIKAVKDLEGFSLTVIGDGPELSYLKSIDKKVKFAGQLPNHRVIEIMRKSDIFVLPSVGETFGMVYLEAMASGCITVGTKADGIDGIIKNGENGFLTYPSSDEIKETLIGIKNLDKDSLKTLSCNSYETICKYTEKKMSNEYLQQIIKIL